MGDPDQQTDQQKSTPDISPRDLKAAFDVAARELSTKDLRYTSGLTPQTFYRFNKGLDVRLSTFQSLVDGLPQEEYEIFVKEVARLLEPKTEAEKKLERKLEKKTEVIAIVSAFVSRCSFAELGELFSAISVALSQNPNNASFPPLRRKTEKTENNTESN